MVITINVTDELPIKGEIEVRNAILMQIFRSVIEDESIKTFKDLTMAFLKNAPEGYVFGLWELRTLFKTIEEILEEKEKNYD